MAFCLINIFRRPSQLRWGASNSLILGEGTERGEKLAFWGWLLQPIWVLCCLLEIFGLFCNILKFFRTFWILLEFLEFFRAFWNLLKYFGIFWMLLEPFKIFQNLSESFRFFWKISDSFLILLDSFGFFWIHKLMQAHASSWELMRARASSCHLGS